MLPYGFDLQQRLQNFYSPLRYFEHLTNNYKRVSPYRIDNSYQQLMVSPFGRSIRDVKYENDFFRMNPEDKRRKSFSVFFLILWFRKNGMSRLIYSENFSGTS